MTSDDTPDAGGAVVSAGTVSAKGVRFLPDGFCTLVPGNTAAVTHGARSPRLEEFVAARADELATDLYLALPHLQRADELSVRACATAEAIVERLLDYAIEHGMVIDGKPAPVLGHLREWMARAEKARARIGADPRSARDLAIGELTVRDLAATLRAAQLEEPPHD